MNTASIILAALAIAAIIFRNKIPNTKGLTKWLKLWSPLFAAPVLAVAFVSLGVLGQWVFKTEDGSASAFGFYDPSTIQRAVLASVILEILNLAFLFTLWWQFRGLFKWFYINHEDKSNSRSDWQGLTPNQRFIVFMVMWAGIGLEWLLIFKFI